jgi:hypothetical protein
MWFHSPASGGNGRSQSNKENGLKKPDHRACFQLYAIQKATQKQFLIDICINNAIIGGQEQNTYAQTEG